MERRTFEDSLKDVFKDAEATPSDKVWTNVELELEKQTGSSIRRRLAFYQMLAAAAVTLALLSSGVAYYIIHDRDQTIEQLVAESQLRPVNDNGQATGSDTGSATSPEVAANAGSRSASDDPATADGGNTAKRESPEFARREERNSAVNNGSVASTGGQSDPHGQAPAITSGIANASIIARSDETYLSLNKEAAANKEATPQRVLPAFYTPTIHQPSVQKAEADPIAAMMSKLAEEEMKLAFNDAVKKDVSQEKVWTSLGVAAGGFSAVNHNASPVQQMGFASNNSAVVANKQAKANGVAYSMGVSFGTKVAPRWVVQGGVNYLTQSSNYVATNVIAGPNYQTLQAESINALGKLPALADAASASDRLAPTVPYSVNNSLKFFSVPMQAGYLLVNRKFGVQLNAGVSTDLFLENTITPEGGSLDKTTQSNGSESPYRTVNFSGLMGTEFSYRLGQRYRIALNPALRYPFSSVYKSDVGIESTPLTFDVGLRFRYIFK